MGFLWDWSKITVVIITVLGLVLNGYLSPVSASIIIALYVMFRGAVRGSKGITKTIFWVFEISFILLLGVNVLATGGGAANLIPLIIDVFSTAVAWIVKMVLAGDITIYHGIFSIIAIIILKNIGINIGSIGVHRAARNTFLIGVPIAMLIVFINLYGGGNALALIGQLLPLLILLAGLYIMMFGWSSSQRKG